MKKVLFCLSLIICLSVLGTVPSFAMEFTIDPATIGSLGDLGYGLAGGMEIDFNDSFIANKYRGQYSAEGTSEGKRLVAQAAANDFITNYAISRGLPLPSNASDYVENLPTDTYSYFKSVYFDNSVRSITNKAKLAETDAAKLDALRFGIGPSAFADWSEYSTFWYNKFIAIGEEQAEDPDAPVDVPVEYRFYVQQITGSIANNIDLNEGDLFRGSNYHLNFTFDRPVSWVCQNPTDSTNWSGKMVKPVEKTGIYVINNLDGSYSWSSYFTGAGNIQRVANSNGYVADNRDWGLLNTTYAPSLWFTFNNSSFNYPSTYRFETLDSLLSYLSDHFKYFDLYVNGDLWGRAGEIDEAPANPIIPEFPDIIDSDSDDPAYWIDLPATDTGEGYFDLTSLFDALVDAIEGALDDDLATDGVLDGTKGLEYEDEAGDAVEDDPIADDDVIDDSIPDPTGLPNIPVPLPPIQDAFTGTTVLAELVHATDVVMPDDLMAVFWGIVFILFIIGLIKVLHK